MLALFEKNKTDDKNKSKIICFSKKRKEHLYYAGVPTKRVSQNIFVVMLWKFIKFVGTPVIKICEYFFKIRGIREPTKRGDVFFPK